MSRQLAVGRTLASNRVYVRNFEYALSFLGTADYVDFGNTAYNLAHTGQITISAWIAPNRLASMAILSKQQRASPFQGWGFYTQSTGTLLFEYVASLGSIYQIRTTDVCISTGIYQHVAVTYNARTIAFYVNSVLQSNTTVSGGGNATYSNNPNLNLGNRNNNEGAGDNDFNGRIDEVQVYTTALAQSDIDSIYRTGTCSISPQSYWKLNEGSGTTVNDSAGSVTGTITGATYITVVPSIPRTLAVGRTVI